MSFASDIRLGLGSLIRNDASQYVIDKDKLDNELVIGMNAKGHSKITSEDAALLSKSSKEADEFADELEKSQFDSIILHASDMVIMARNGIEKWFKERKVNKKLRTILSKNLEQSGDLPKDDTVRRAEKKVFTKAAGELENMPREKGGRIRETRIK